MLCQHTSRDAFSCKALSNPGWIFSFCKLADGDFFPGERLFLRAVVVISPDKIPVPLDSTMFRPPCTILNCKANVRFTKSSAYMPVFFMSSVQPCFLGWGFRFSSKLWT
jgi:hypothetical protein